MNEIMNRALVVGGGIAGMTAATALADLGTPVILLEQTSKLGGHAAHWACMATDECAHCSACLVQSQLSRVLGHPLIETIMGARIERVTGTAGDFKIQVLPMAPENSGSAGLSEGRLKEKRIFRAGSIVLATGFEVYDPRENPLLGHGRLDGVWTLEELDHILQKDQLGAHFPQEKGPSRIAFIQCVGSRDRMQGREYCSQFCCRGTIRLVSRLRYLRPEIEATIFYIDLQIMSKEFQSFYQKARQGVRFIQGVPAELSRGGQEGTIRVYSVQQGGRKTEALEFDGVVLATGLLPNQAHAELSGAIKLSLNGFGFFENGESEVQVASSRAGIFLAGACAGPTDIQNSRKQALAAASRAHRLLKAGEFALQENTLPAGELPLTASDREISAHG